MLVAFALLTAAFLPQAPASSPALPVAAVASPSASDLTLPPESAQLVTILEGRGVQIYTCSSVANGYKWVFQAPEADLFNLATGQPAGHHSAGPTWTLTDGSAVRGTVLRTQPAQTASDVPWLLLHTDTNRNAAAAGTQTPEAPVAGIPGAPAAAAGMTPAPITYIRRYNTHGGVAPAPTCTASQAGTTLRVPYSASYAFYTTPGEPSGLLSTGSQAPANPSAAAPKP